MLWGPESPSLACFMTSGGGRAELWGRELEDCAQEQSLPSCRCRLAQSTAEQPWPGGKDPPSLYPAPSLCTEWIPWLREERAGPAASLHVTVRKCVGQVPPSSKEVAVPVL